MEATTMNLLLADGPALTEADAHERMSLLYNLHAKAIFRYLLRLTLGDRREAEDALQETLLRTWRHLRSKPMAVESSRPWLYTVARRVVIDAVRARKARPLTADGVTDLTELADRDTGVDRMINGQTVRDALMSLSREHRDVLVEVYYRERSVKEAAEILGVPEGTVKSRTYYALKALREAAIQHGILD
jgi:RNA polymerase sigma-70 factor (ECF subfamily)